MKRLLCSYTTGDRLIVCRAYFVTEHHRQVTWDGVSPLVVELGRILRNAAAYARRNADAIGPVRSVHVAGLPAAGQEPYYYFTVEFETRNAVHTQEVILDLDGTVIEPEVRTFDDPDEYYRYLDTIQESHE